MYKLSEIDYYNFEMNFNINISFYNIVVIYLVTSILLYLYLPQKYLIAYLTTVFLWFVVFFFNKNIKRKNEKNN